MEKTLDNFGSRSENSRSQLSKNKTSLLKFIYFFKLFMNLLKYFSTVALFIFTTTFPDSTFGYNYYLYLRTARYPSSLFILNFTHIKGKHPRFVPPFSFNNFLSRKSPQTKSHIDVISLTPLLNSESPSLLIFLFSIAVLFEALMLYKKFFSVSSPA